jgi:hypothetical protein
MASSIVSTTIDETFPVAGRDNDSQGFRDNFFVIKQNFQAAKTEIEDLQDGVARVDTNNNFNLNNITEATLLASPLTVNTTYNTGVVTPTVSLSWEEGYVYVIRATTDHTLILGDFPNNKYCQMRIVLFSNAASDRQITFSGGTMKTGNWPAGPVGFTNGIVIGSSVNPIIVDAFTYDGGLNIFLQYVGTFS